MVPGIFARTYAAKSAAAVCAQARSDGFAALQFNLSCVGLPTTPERVPDGVAETIAGAAKSAGIELAALSGTYNMIHPDRALRARGARHGSRGGDALHRLPRRRGHVAIAP